MDKVKFKLSVWHSKFNSMAGKVILIKSVMAFIPTYIMQCFTLPVATCSEFDRININFLWGSSEDQRTIHDLNWDTVTCPKNKGVLGILFTMNRSEDLLTNFVWRLDEFEESW